MSLTDISLFVRFMGKWFTVLNNFLTENSSNVKTYNSKKWSVQEAEVHCSSDSILMVYRRCIEYEIESDVEFILIKRF